MASSMLSRHSARLPTGRRLGSIFQQPGRQISIVLWATCSVIAIWGIIGWLFFYRDPGSIFFDSRFAFERMYSKERLSPALEFLHQTQTAGFHFTQTSAIADLGKKAPSNEICIGLPTVRRTAVSRQYVSTTVASILEGLSLQERSMITLSMFFADNDYASHPDFQAPWTRALIDDTWAAKFNKKTIPKNSTAFMKRVKYDQVTSRAKGTLDYSLALERCVERSSAPYVAVFEDDILFARGWVAPAVVGLHNADKYIKNRNGESADWLFMRLFTQERSTGWGGRRAFANGEFGESIRIDLWLVVAAVLFNFLAPRSIRHRVDYRALLLLCVFTVPALRVMYYRSGRANLVPIPDGLNMENYGCCSQALIFNRRHIRGLTEHLRNAAITELETDKPHTNYDLLTVDYALGNGLSMLALHPMQAQHMGTKSSVGGAVSESQAVWSKAFEELTPRRMEDLRDLSMRSLFGDEWRKQSGLEE